jgi:PAS domain S-box-containing protein
VEREAVRCTKDGRPIHVSLIGYPIVENSRQTGAYAIYRDITERMQAQDALRESGIRYQMLFESAHDAIFMMSEERFIECNPPALLMFDCRKEDIIGQTPIRFSPPLQPDGSSSREKAMEHIRLAFSGTSDPFEWRHMRLNGTEFDAEVTLNRVDLVGGPFLQVTVRDVSDRKRSEEEKRRLEAQLVQAQKMESIGRLAGGVAHDFNNMLSAILGHVELAMDKCRPPEPIFHDLKVIEKAAHRSAALTQQLLAFARKQTVAPKILDLNDVVAGMLTMLQRLIGEDIDFAWMPGAGLWQIKIDPSQVDQVLANLCVNARDAIDGIGKITIETENVVLDEAYCGVHPEFTCGQFVMLAVSDNGHGMDRETLDQIFEPFFTTKERGKGTGLGLATVYGILKQNDGFINVYSEPGHGSTFKLYLPRFLGDAAGPVIEKGAELLRGSGETVLLVEDEDIILNLGRVMLEKLGYRVLAAGTPSEALHMARAHADEIRLLITDVVMPEMSGRDLANVISTIKPGLKCLYLSGYTANVIVHRGVLDEGVHFLQKPFSLLDLSLKVRGALE